MKKRWIGLILAAAMAVSAVLPAYGASAESKQMSQVIGKVKQAVLVPEQFSEFDYGTYQSSGSGDTYWRLNWYSPDDKADSQNAGSVNVQADSQGMVLSYSLGYYHLERANLSTLEREKGQEIAADFLEKVMPQVSKNMKVIEVTSSRNAFSYRFQQHVNGIPVKGRTATLEVDKTLEKVTYYQGFAPQTLDFGSAEGVLSKQDAAKKYLDQIGIKLQYSSYYDSDNKKTVVFPVYRALSEAGKAIDAMTGKTVEVDLLEDDVIVDEAVEEDSAATMMNPVTGGSYQMTEEEQEKAEILAGQISASQAASKVRQAFPVLGSAYQLESSSRYQDYKDPSQYQWSLNFVTKEDENGISYAAYASVDAKTGEVLSFHIGLPAGSDPLSVEEAKEQADSLIAKVAGEKSKSVKLSQQAYADLLETVNANPKGSRQYTFTYTRYVNGIEYPGNRITVTYDPQSAEFVTYSMQWDNNVSFPKLDKVKAKAEIFDIMAKELDFGLQYVVGKDGKTTLLYDFRKMSSQYFNPFTGETVDGRNRHTVDSSQIPNYTDIEDNWAQSRIERLTDNGYYLYTGTEFNPNTAISQENFLRFLAFAMGYSGESVRGWDRDTLYERMMNSQVITQEEKNPGASITRQDAAVYAVRMLGYEEVARQGEIFVKPYTDTEDQAYWGYLAVAKGLDLLVEGEDGDVGPTQKVTNAYTAYLLFQLMTR